MIDAELLDGFRKESAELLDELEAVVETLEESGAQEFPAAAMQEFSQKIDRIMGAAKTLLAMVPGHQGIVFVSSVAEMCKTMGYQAAALQRVALVPFFAGFWAETLEVLREVFEHLQDEAKTKAVIGDRSAQLQRRLAWLAEKVAPHSEEEQQKVVALLKRL